MSCQTTRLLFNGRYRPSLITVMIKTVFGRKLREETYFALHIVLHQPTILCDAPAKMISLHSRYEYFILFLFICQEKMIFFHKFFKKFSFNINNTKYAAFHMCVLHNKKPHIFIRYYIYQSLSIQL